MEIVNGRTFVHPRELRVGDTVRSAFVMAGGNGTIVNGSNEVYKVTAVIESGEGRWEVEGGMHRAHWMPGSLSLIEVIKRADEGRI